MDKIPLSVMTQCSSESIALRVNKAFIEAEPLYMCVAGLSFTI